MKKIIFLISLILAAFISIGQPVVNRSGPANTVSDARWKAQYNLIVPVYPDTTTANLAVNIGIDSCYAIIATRDSNYLWYRQCSPKKWVKLGSGGSSGVSGNIYTIDGTLLGDRVATLSTYALSFNRSGIKQLSLETGVSRISSPDNGEFLELYDDSLLLVGGNQIFKIKADTGSFSKRVSYTTNLGSTFTRHTLVDKNYVDSVAALSLGSVTSVGSGFGLTGGPITTSGTLVVDTTSGGVTSWRRTKKIIDSLNAAGWARQGLQSVITADPNLTTNNVIDAGTNDFEIFNANSIELNSDLRTLISADINSLQLVPDSTTSSKKIVYTGNINGTLTTPNALVTRSLVDSLISVGGGGALPDTAAAIRSDFPNTYADLTTSIVDEEGYYNGFPWPVQKGDTTIVFLKHSTTHADTGSMRYYKSWNGGREWTTGTNVTVNGNRISISSLQTGIFNNRITICYTEDTYDSVKFAYSDDGGTSFYSAGALPYQVNWTGSPSIQTMFNIVSDTIYSAQYELDADSSRAFLVYSADNGVSWVRGNTVLLQPGGGFPNGRTSEWSCVITELGTMDANTKLGSLHRNEDYGYYTFVSTANGFQTSTEDVTNFMYEFGNQVDRAPVNIYNTQQMIYIVCGNRRVNGLYALEYVTIPAASFYTNTQSAYSKVRKLYAATAATKAASIDFGYPVFYTYNQKPYVTLYDVSPVYHSSGEGGDDDVRSINFPLLDRGYSEKFNDANQSITDSTQTLVSYPDLLLDCMGSWDYDGDAGTTDSVWEAKEDGWYMVNAIATFEANGTGSYRQMYVIVVDPGVNTTATNQMISKTTIPGNSSISDFNRVECNGMAYIKQGEQVKVYVKHDATSALNLLNTSRETMASVKITLVR